MDNLSSKLDAIKEKYQKIWDTINEKANNEQDVTEEEKIIIKWWMEEYDSLYAELDKQIRHMLEKSEKNDKKLQECTEKMKDFEEILKEMNVEIGHDDSGVNNMLFTDDEIDNKLAEIRADIDSFKRYFDERTKELSEVKCMQSKFRSYLDELKQKFATTTARNVQTD